MDDAEPKRTAFLTLELAGDVTRSFSSAREFEEWLAAQEEEFRWFLQHEQNAPPFLNEVAEAYRSFFSQSRNAIEQHERGQQSAEQTANNIKSFAEVLGRPRPVLGESPWMPLLEGLKEEFNSNSRSKKLAVASVLHCERWPADDPIDLRRISSPIYLKAIATWQLLRAGVTPSRTKSLASALSRFGERFETLSGKLQERIDEADTASREQLENYAAQNDAHRQEIQEVAERAVSQIEDTHRRYTELMQLQAPVSYWTDKSLAHGKSASDYRVTLLWASGGAIAFLTAAYAIGWAALEFGGEQEASVGMAFYVAGFVAALTAITLWLIRIVVRLYMSQQHLQIDAGERAAMLQTYLALTEEGKVEVTERQLVLGAVFRPTPDGIIKDDGAPNLTPAAMLAALLDRK